MINKTIDVLITHGSRLSPPGCKDCNWKIQKLSPSPEIHISTPHHLQNYNREVYNMMVWRVEMICYWFIKVVFDIRAMPIQTDVERILSLTNVL